MADLVIKPGREASLLRRHPWIFTGAIAEVHGSPESGETIRVVSSEGQFLAWAAYSPKSQIIARVWSFQQDDDIDDAFLSNRIVNAIGMRKSILAQTTTDAIRLVHGESDGLPGLIVDQYGEVVVIQFLTAGTEYWRRAIVDIITKETGAQTIYERSDLDVRLLEGLPLRKCLLHGKNPADKLLIHETGSKFWVDVVNGQKTGFYIDQRDNRTLVRSYSKGKDILDCFCYTGGFSVNAFAGGASRLHLVDDSRDALEIAKANLKENQIEDQRYSIEKGDVFHVLRLMRDKGKIFDMVILDPPKFAPTSAYANKAARGYKDINLLALKLLVPGGLLVTFSCSSGISEELFQKIIAGAALDAGVDAQILQRLHQGQDHPVSLVFPEGAYLKGFIVRVGGG